jgi:hypothetical protein
MSIDGTIPSDVMVRLRQPPTVALRRGRLDCLVGGSPVALRKFAPSWPCARSPRAGSHLAAIASKTAVDGGYNLRMRDAPPGDLRNERRPPATPAIDVEETGSSSEAWMAEMGAFRQVD